MEEIYASFFPTHQRECEVIATYVVLCLMYVIFGLRSSSKLLQVILKCAPVFFLVTFIIFVTSKLDIDDSTQVKNNPVNFNSVIFGLICCLLGDFYLVFDRLFLFGILSFSAAQLTYIELFDGWTLLFSFQVVSSEIITAVAILLVSALVFSTIFLKLSWGLVAPALLYCVLISIMLWCAMVALLHGPSLPTALGAVGASLFYTSDLLLAMNRWSVDIPYGPHLIMVTYYAAQMFIPLHVIKRFL